MFAINENFQEKLIKTLEKLNGVLESFNNNSEEKGGAKMTKFEELLAQYGKTADEITFDTEGLSDEQLAEKFKKAFEDDEPITTEEEACGKKKKKCSEMDNDDSDKEDELVATEEEACKKKKKCSDEDEGSDDPIAKEDEACKKKKKCSDDNESFILKYELSHDDIRSALYQLLDEYSDDGYCNCWIAEVYDNKFIYQDYAENKYYRRGYSKDGDTVSLMDNKVEVFNEWLSKEEKDALDTLKENYSTLEAKYNELKMFKDNYDAAELKAKKDAIFSRSEYSVIADDEAFKTLVSDAEKYSIDEVESKAKAIFADYVIRTGTFSAKDDGEKKPKVLGFNFNKKETKSGPYGNLFKKD